MEDKGLFLKEVHIWHWCKDGPQEAEFRTGFWSHIARWLAEITSVILGVELTIPLCAAGRMLFLALVEMDDRMHRNGVWADVMSQLSQDF